MNTKDKKRLHVVGKPARRRPASPKRPKKEAETQILYTPAKPFNRNRVLLRLATVAAVVIAIVFGMAIFFKVSYVTVSGAQKYTPWEVKQASQIQDGEGLLSISEARISARIRGELPYVDKVRVGIKLPDTVNIEITELDVVYAVETDQLGWCLIDAQGRIVEKINSAKAKGYTRIVGVQIQDAAVGTQVVAAQEKTEENAEQEEQDQQEGQNQESPLIPVPALPVEQMLDAAIKILQALESNGVLGDVDTVDVSSLSMLNLWYDGRYQVTLGDNSRLEYKIGAMKAAVQQMGEYQNGYLDVSFTTWPDQVGYTPFESGK